MAESKHPNIVELEERTHSALKALGATPDEVADKLRETGSRGIPMNVSSCPVATYLTNSGVPLSSLFEQVYAVVPVEQVPEDLRDEGEDEALVLLVGSMSREFPAVKQFMIAFDNDGEYQDLRV